MANHAALGAEIVLVSGSFYDVLAPIRDRLVADALLCTELEVADGLYTGSIRTQLIDEGEWKAIEHYLRGRQPVDLKLCFAYGDHVSDVWFMEKMGHPVVVGDSLPMREVACQRGWRMLSLEERSG